MRELILKHTGISLSEQKQHLIYGRLSRRLRALSLVNFRQYYDLIMDGNEEELEKLANAITTNKTAFFREPYHFDRLKNEIIPEYLINNASSRRLRIWSSGCSTGEEAYSIAISLYEVIPDIDMWDVKILATDIDSSVIDKAKQGIYPQQQVAELSQKQLKNYFMKGSGSHEGLVRVKHNVRELIRFRCLNINKEWPMQGPFDIIFCRNMVIYFNKPTQSILFDRYADKHASDGHLFIGHSESLHGVTERYKLLGQTIYRKIA